LEKKNDIAQQRANAVFKKEQQAREGAKARQEYETAGIEVRKKTEQLKALRLAKEASSKKEK
jgi:hypothetical protein